MVRTTDNRERFRSSGPRYRSTRTRKWMGRVAIAMLVAAVASVVGAVAQFQTNRRQIPSTVILAMDVSDSMKADDVAPNRLVAAQEAARAFVDEIPEGIRVGLVTFAGEAKLAAAPGSSRGTLSDAISNVSTSYGTVIGDAMVRSLDSVKVSWKKAGQGRTAIVLLSDGEDYGSTVKPSIAAAQAKSLGVRVYTVSLGAAVDSGMAGQLLKDVAAETGAESFDASSSDQLTQIYRDLGALISDEVTVSNLGAYLMILAVLLAIGAGVLVILANQSDY